MAIRIIEGVPGSGKSYYAVHHLVAKYFAWDKTTDEFKPLPREDGRPLRVITNIERFTLGESLTELVAAAGGPLKFFSWPYQERMAKDAALVYVIDEAQLLFPRTFRDLGVFAFFQKHRHLGIDIYLVTQDIKTLALELRSIAESLIRASRRTFSFMGEFRYKFLGSAEDRSGYATKVLRRDGRIFAVYRSMQAAETERIRSAPLKWFVIAVVFVGLFFGSIYGISKWVFRGRAQAAPAPARVASSSKPAAAQLEEPARTLPAPAPLIADGWTPASVGVVRGVVGDADDGLVYVEVAHVERSYRMRDFELVCRCRAESLRAGSLVEMWARAGRESPQPTRQRATGGSAPSGPSPTSSPPAAVDLPRAPR